MSELAHLVASDHLSPLDAELGVVLMKRASRHVDDVEGARIVGLTGALLSAWRRAGNSCIDLEALAGSAPWGSAERALPIASEWRRMLSASQLCAVPGALAPLVLDGDRLYLYRYHQAEASLAAHVRARVSAPPAPLPDDALRALFRRLFQPSNGATDWQAVAAACALRSRLAVITGGPGTGKTTTVARILALVASADPHAHIAIAAPTGKAAARLAESIGSAELDVDAAVRDRMRVPGQTLHRLLGYEPWRDRFRHGADEPLPYDVVVVDEASMVDLLLMERLFAAVRPDARIILLGDPDQLASVEAGYVLGDLCQAAERCASVHGAAFGAWFATVSGASVDCAGEPHPLRDVVVRLRRSYRFEKQAGIGAAASAIRDGDGDATCAALGGSHADATRREPVRAIGALLEPVAGEMEAYLASRSPGEALARLRDFRVLTAHRRGNFGVEGLNASIERWLRAKGLYTRAQWYDLRPILVTANDPATRLYNGDIGVVFRTEDGPAAWFEAPDGSARSVSLARLPAHETAWAMTVHKSQGSEFANVLLVLPEEQSALLTRELIYTGVTRARERVTVVASESVLRAAVGRVTERASGLPHRLLA